MESSKAPKQTISITPLANTKMILHAIRHANSNIHGILIGSIVDTAGTTTGTTLEISNALPVFHSTPTKPLLEMALRLAESYCYSSSSDTNTKQQIVGWYTGNERNNDTTPNQAALKIMRSIASQWSLNSELLDKGDEMVEPVLGFISFDGLSSLLSTTKEGNGDDDNAAVCGLHWYGSDSKHHWLESYPSSNIITPSSSSFSNMTELIQQAISASLDNRKGCQDVLVYDFEDHLEGNDASQNDWIRNECVTKFVQEYTK